MSEWLIEHNGHRITSDSQCQVVKALKLMGHTGMTSRELEEFTGMDHGKASGALSMLHLDGVVALLCRRREGFAVYVLCEHVAGRETRPRRHNVHAVRL